MFVLRAFFTCHVPEERNAICEFSDKMRLHILTQQAKHTICIAQSTYANSIVINTSLREMNIDLSCISASNCANLNISAGNGQQSHDMIKPEALAPFIF